MPTPLAVRRQLEASIAYVRSRIYTMENDLARQLLNQYMQAYEVLRGQLDDAFRRQVAGETWSTRDANFITRTNSLLGQINAEMERLNAQVYDALVQAQIDAYRASYYGNAWIIDQFTPPDFTPHLPLLPTEAVRAQLLFPYEDNTQFFRLEANRADFIARLRKSMVASQINGDTIYQAQKRLSDALGLEIDRRTNAAKAANEGNYNRTEMIARTELLRGSNLGNMAIYDANKDVIDEVEYIATLDTRTCTDCGPLDGQRWPVGEVPDVPPIHPNCRCTIAPVTKSFADMGLDSVPEMGVGTRASMYGPVAGSTTYDQWAAMNSISRADDGGLPDLAPGKPPRTPGAMPARAKPLIGRGLSVK